MKVKLLHWVPTAGLAPRITEVQSVGGFCRYRTGGGPSSSASPTHYVLSALPLPLAVWIIIPYLPTGVSKTIVFQCGAFFVNNMGSHLIYTYWHTCRVVDVVVALHNKAVDCTLGWAHAKSIASLVVANRSRWFQFPMLNFCSCRFMAVRSMSCCFEVAD